MLLLSALIAVESTSCPNSTAKRETKPLYLLTLVPFPDPRPGVGWDGGLGALPGAKVARDEINSRTDLLPGRHIELIVENIEACSLNEAGTGVVNLVRYSVNSPCHPVVAVIGLLCSSHTSIVSPIAGRDGFNLIQLSAANSPIFQTRNKYFPHLWRFLGSATVYSDAILAIMDQFNWQRFGIVYDSGSASYSEFAKYFEQQIRVSRNKSLVFSVGVRGVKNFYFNHIVSNIRQKEVSVLVVLLNQQQASVLLNRTLDAGLSYPQYTWIHIEAILQRPTNKKQGKFSRASQGHIHLYTQTKRQNDSEVLVSGETFSAFNRKYLNNLELAKKSIGSSINTDVIFASYLYDQVWALALAVNNSIPVLKNRNFSIDTYTIGQPEITEVIEKEMARLSFEGAGGLVEFNHYHGVSTPVKIFWVPNNNGTEKLVGIYNPLCSSNFVVDINPGDLPKDRLPVPHTAIPLPMAILLYIIAGVVIVFTTVQLFIYLHYRDHKAIKATSPYLSLLMFAGCYLYCLAAILGLTIWSFIVSPLALTILESILALFILNGVNLILLTLLIKLLRVYHIFFSRLKMDLGKHWNNLSLFLIIIGLTILPNIITAVEISLTVKDYISYITNVRKGTATIDKPPENDFSKATITLTVTYLGIYLLLICFLAILTRKIRYSDFKDTKKINFFITVFIIASSLTVSLYAIFVRKNKPIADAILVIGLLITPAASQLILFLPKILPIVLERYNSSSRALSKLSMQCTQSR